MEVDPSLTCHFPVPGSPSSRGLAYSSMGSVDAPVLVVCLPGLLETRHVFRPVLELAGSTSSVRVVAVDYCGRGDSDALPEHEPYRASLYLRDLEALLEHLRCSRAAGSPVRLHLAGSSMGGLLALHLAQQPELQIEGIVLNDIGSRLDWQALYGLQRMMVPRSDHDDTPAWARALEVDARVLHDVRSPSHWDLPYQADLWGMRFEALLRSSACRLALVHSIGSPLCSSNVARITKLVRPDLELMSVAGDSHPVSWTPAVLDWISAIWGLQALGIEGAEPADGEPDHEPTPARSAAPGEAGVSAACLDARTPAARVESANGLSPTPAAIPQQVPVTPLLPAAAVARVPIALVTGANSGLGREVALSLARRGWRLVLAGRCATRMQPVLDRISAIPGAPGAGFLPLELDDLDSVRDAAHRFLDRGWPLQLLVNNAGAAGVRGLTRSGFEYAFGVHHIGHFALTLHLWPALLEAGAARVVHVASRSHHWVWRWRWDALREPTRSWTGVSEYARSKLANVLFSAELARRCKGLGVSSFALHPGVLDTGIWRRLPAPIQALNRLRLDPVAEGVSAVLHCACEAHPGLSGAYFAQSRPSITSPLAADPALARALWERSIEWTGLTVALPG